MSRQIKFRAWDKRNQVWIYTDHIDGNYWFWEIVNKETSNYILMQYTELLDKNKKEIYEGDIISGGKNGFWRAVVIYENKNASFSLCIKWNKDFGSQISPNGYSKNIKYFFYETYNIEVIGNKYENPKLLKQGE